MKKRSVFKPDYLTVLTKLDVQHPRGGDGALDVGGHALEVARVGRVQVPDPETRAVRHGPVGDAPWLLHHGGVIFQPPHGRRRVPGDTAEKLGCLTQRGRDVVHGSFEADEDRPWKGK